MRCFKGYFQDASAAYNQPMRRCWGGMENMRTDGRPWGRCRYLERCLGMSVKKWLKKHKDLAGRLPWLTENVNG